MLSEEGVWKEGVEEGGSERRREIQRRNKGREGGIKMEGEGKRGTEGGREGGREKGKESPLSF